MDTSGATRLKEASDQVLVHVKGAGEYVTGRGLFVAVPLSSRVVLCSLRRIRFGSKIETLVRTLLILQRTHPGDKSIVYSQWFDMLQLIGHALSRNDIKHVNAAGAMSMCTALNRPHA